MRASLLCAISNQSGVYILLSSRQETCTPSFSLPQIIKPRDSHPTLAPTRFDAWFDFLRMEIQLNFPRDEVSTRGLYYHDFRSNVVSQIQPHGSLAHSLIQNIANDQRRTMSGGKARPVCTNCSIVFGRIQEYKRHIRDKHTDRRRCPFCDFQWSRPNIIKVHLVSKHAEKFTPEILERFKGLRGREVVEFVDAYDY